MKRSIRCMLLFFLLPILAQAQLPKSNVYVFDLNYEGDSLIFTQPRFLTYYNENSYNNHPHFINNEELFISSRLPYEAQPDIYQLNLSTKERLRVTATMEGEYSPRKMPDYYNFSAVRMEFFGQDTVLRLWQFPIDRSNNGQPVFRDISNIGYYEWLTSRDLLLFQVGNPNQLVKADIYARDTEIIATNPGRCFRNLGNGRVLFVEKSPNGNRIMQYNTRSFGSNASVQEIAPTLSTSEDFAVLYNGTILMARGSEIFRFRPGTDEAWQPMVDLRGYNITNISRLEISPNSSRIAIVAN